MKENASVESHVLFLSFMQAASKERQGREAQNIVRVSISTCDVSGPEILAFETDGCVTFYSFTWQTYASRMQQLMWLSLHMSRC
jgi:hypothetical protein